MNTLPGFGANRLVKIFKYNIVTYILDFLTCRKQSKVLLTGGLFLRIHLLLPVKVAFISFLTVFELGDVFANSASTDASFFIAFKLFTACLS